ncbi:hypothetical protein BC628DRAFT_1405199 [Trametes gibbosa]|nr:hypothetical protein BC628DRAFT_1405199 [Trametes gibbosa]
MHAMSRLTHSMTAIGGIPSNTSLLDRLQWRYHLALGGIVPFNLVVRTILKGVQDHSAKGGHLPAGVNLGDIFILGSHIANTITLADASSPENILSYRCQWGIIAITPFAMLARWKRLVLLALPLNLVQRALIHGLLMTSIATVHQLARYPATLHNRHAAAELLCITIPDLREEVVKLMRDGVSVPELW